MKKLHVTLLATFPMLAIAVGLLWFSQSMTAQQTANPSFRAAAQQESMPQQKEDPNAAPENKTFTGKIVKSGDKLVLADSADQATYQLDDQQKAQEFVNKKVNVTGVLDASTGVIRVSAIEPA